MAREWDGNVWIYLHWQLLNRDNGDYYYMTSLSGRITHLAVQCMVHALLHAVHYVAVTRNHSLSGSVLEGVFISLSSFLSSVCFVVKVPVTKTGLKGDTHLWHHSLCVTVSQNILRNQLGTEMVAQVGPVHFQWQIPCQYGHSMTPFTGGLVNHLVI